MPRDASEILKLTIGDLVMQVAMLQSQCELLREQLKDAAKPEPPPAAPSA